MRDSGRSHAVEIGISGDDVLVRHAKEPDGPALTVNREAWRDFIGAVQDGEFDLNRAHRLGWLTEPG